MVSERKSPAKKRPPLAEVLLYATNDGQTRLEVQLRGETVWLTQSQLADLFQTTPQNITLHLAAIYREGELDQAATCKDYLQVRREGAREVKRHLKHYNLDAIISVGYRVQSRRGTQFRIWATERLREYLVKGFTLDDDRLKRAGGGSYFEELLARIRDIRSSEKVFWRKVLDIYATSIDYDPSAEASQRFFATVQNKMHWAAHGHTAAEIVHARADGRQPHMGMTNWVGEKPRREEAGIAKNYLAADEIEVLNRIVTAYLEFAEVQALNRKPMYMRDWIGKLDDFLRLGDRAILSHAGKISHEEALRKAETEFEKFRLTQLNEVSRVERDFEKAVKKLPLPVRQAAPRKKK